MDASSLHRQWILAITGASGMRYAVRLLDVLTQSNITVHLIVSEAGLRVLNEEEGIKVSSTKISPETLLGTPRDNVIIHSIKDIGACIASGSFRFAGMVVAPCSMSTLGAIASGSSQNLIHRAADVTLKEQRKLILVPRETPLSPIHLENMLKLSRCGAHIVPAMPGFYHQPKTVEDIVDMMVMKILDAMRIDNSLVKRWKES